MTATIKNEPFAFAGFAEMSEQEMLAVDGGTNMEVVGAGGILMGAGAAIANYGSKIPIPQVAGAALVIGGILVLGGFITAVVGNNI